MRKLLLISLLAAGSALAQDRPDLNGVWRLDASHSAVSDIKLKSETLSIRQDDDSIKIEDESAEDSGKERKSGYECNTNGKECEVKVNGEKLTISAYYNGDVLVMFEQRKGTDSATKERWKTSKDGNTLTIELLNLAKPGQKPDTLVYAKQVSVAKESR
jgi:hypothetical protein